MPGLDDQIKSWLIAPSPARIRNTAPPRDLSVEDMRPLRPQPAMSADLDPGQQRVRLDSPSDRIAVRERLPSHQRDAVQGQPVPAQVGDPPPAIGEREPGVLPRYRGYLREDEVHLPPPGPGTGRTGLRHALAGDQPELRNRGAGRLGHRRQ